MKKRSDFLTVISYFYLLFIFAVGLITIISMVTGCGGNGGTINDPPVANDQAVSTAEDTPVAITLTGSDADGDPLTYTIATPPANGSLSGTAPNLTYTPNADFSGADSFTFTVNDGAVDSGVATVSISITAQEEILLEDNFPGYEENADWDDSWTIGIGSLAYYATNPGFARLLLDGPGAGGTYHNAEKKHNGTTSGGFLYCDFEVRLRNSNNNGWDAPGAPSTPDPTYGLGSRGWGFWNNQMFISGAHVIWFTSISPETVSAFRGTRVWIICDGIPVLMQDLGIDLTQWHTYRIQWRTEYIGVFVDDMINPIAEVIDPNNIPDETLSFTVWTDNYCFSGDLANPIISYLSVPDINQYIDVDYLKIYKP